MNNDVCSWLSPSNPEIRVQLFLPKFHAYIYHFQSEAGNVANANFALKTSALLPLAYALPIYCFTFWFGLALRTIGRTRTHKTNPSTFFNILDV